MMCSEGTPGMYLELIWPESVMTPIGLQASPEFALHQIPCPHSYVPAGPEV